jgi:hypothetical protein
VKAALPKAASVRFCQLVRRARVDEIDAVALAGGDEARGADLTGVDQMLG